MHRLLAQKAAFPDGAVANGYFAVLKEASSRPSPREAQAA
jgi:hypothetical protein